MIIDEIVKDLKNKGIEIDIYREDVTVCINKSLFHKQTIDTNSRWSDGRANIKNYLRRTKNEF